MSVRTFLTKREVRKAIGLDGIFDITYESLLAERKDLEKAIEKDTFTYMSTYSQFLTQLTTVFQKRGKDINDLINRSGDDGRQRIAILQVMEAYRKIDKRLRDLTKQQGHLDVGVFTKSLLVMYARIDEAADIQERSGGARKPRVPVATYDKEAKKNVFTYETRDIQELRRIAKELQQLYIMSLAVDKLKTERVSEVYNAGGNNLDLIDAALDEFLGPNAQAKVTAAKTKTINIITGVGTQKIELEDKALNTFKGKASSLLKRSEIASLDKGVTRRGIKNLLSKYGDDLANIQGSKPLETEIVDQITTLALGKKPSPYQSRSTKSITRKLGGKTKISKAVASAIIAQRVASKGLPPLTGRPKKAKGESGRGDVKSREINKLRMKINQRLPAEVRRNMGRPALENQTGRFSNSVTLTELRQGPKTLVGKYAYMFAPYETFENEGERRWPTGYNPKPLITKSIRNLAVQYTEQKFTLRRE